MKTKFTFIRALIIIAISGISIAASAQSSTPPPAVTPIPGPTIPTNIPNGPVPDKYICVGQTISLISNPTPPNPGITDFIWWKEQTATGPWKVVADTKAPINVYNTEVTTTPGYYIYEVQTMNASGCESLISQPINIFALPVITPAISGPTSVCQSVPGNPAYFQLSATPVADPTYTYTYQWTRNGIPVPNSQGGNTPTITGLTENTPGVSVTYAVNVSYATANGTATNIACMATATQIVTVTPLPTTPTIQWN